MARGTRAKRAAEITVTEAARNFSDVIARVRYRGDRYTLTKGGLPVAEIRPSAAAFRLTARELAERLASMPHLELADAERFATDLEEARRDAGPAGIGAWD